MRELELEHLDGPLAGQRARFAADRLRITIGRDAACDVRYPADAAGVGSEHLDLVRDAGRYELRVNTSDPVTVHGASALDGQELAEGDVVRLGGSKGPAFRVHYAWPAGTVKPADEESSRRASDQDEASEIRSLRRRLGFAMAALAVLVMFGLGVFLRGTAESRGVQKSLSLLEDGVRDNRPVAFQDAIARTSRSVFLVIRKGRYGESPLGTAWVAGEHVLATNAHVAVTIADAHRQRAKLIVRSTGPESRDFEVKGVLVHPGYLAFHDVWDEYRPTLLDASGSGQEMEFIPGYDVALLRVADDAQLPDPLPIASPATLRSLRPGDPVAFVGFPMERLVQLDTTAPNPVSQVASIVGLTTFTRIKPVDGSGQLIEHSLPSTGGASGSPIIDARGEVIALVSAVNVVPSEQGRIPSPALVNFAQRVDVLMPLLADPPAVDLDALRETWRHDLQRYESRGTALQRVVSNSVDRWSDQWGESVEPTVLRQGPLDIDGSLLVAGDPAGHVDLPGAPGHYLAVAISASGKPLTLAIVKTPGPDAPAGSRVDVLGVDRSVESSPPMVAVDLDATQPLTVVVMEPGLAHDPAVARSSAELKVYYVPPQAAADGASPPTARAPDAGS